MATRRRSSMRRVSLVSCARASGEANAMTKIAMAAQGRETIRLSSARACMSAGATVPRPAPTVKESTRPRIFTIGRYGLPILTTIDCLAPARLTRARPSGSCTGGRGPWLARGLPRLGLAPVAHELPGHERGRGRHADEDGDEDVAELHLEERQGAAGMEVHVRSVRQETIARDEGED